ncbi:Bacteriophage head to tail connecting protein [Cohaesibacter marisflavi]|uniref:Bacteriophage head to tail connecting protein n=1 Tax=Cohaesibacter marisflavi TaxID=655353 RepID=A0A1I5JY38_9HYPH|nr:portal protein [Cohaesibacter marisflavi]SFO77660.1 Bacteriophage head to tail connecting protein [Cohaesibacter marisflavi]
MAKRQSTAPNAAKEPENTGSSKGNDEAKIKKLKRFYKKADTEFLKFKPMLDEAFDYAIPYRKGISETGAGEKRVNKAFDQTAIVGAFRFAGRLWQDFVSEEMFRLAPGDILTDKVKNELRPELETYTSVITGMASNGEFDLAFHEMGLDLSAGTGAMYIQEGEDTDTPARFVAVPIDELRLLKGGHGDVRGIFWDRKWDAWEVEDEFWDERAKFGPNFKDKLRKNESDDVKLRVATLYDRKAKKWITTTWVDCDEDTIIREEESLTNPWLTPRYFRVPGETMGRGPVMLAMPSIKTLNTAQSLTLQAAAIALLGIWTAVDDGVFNPDQSAIEPGAIWTVARNGGVLGPTVQRMTDPRLDTNNIILNDLRMAVQATMMDQSLPPDGAAVRSATEILERVKRLATDHIGAFGRLVYEIIAPLARRLIEIAYKKGLIKAQIPIDQILIQVKVSSPLATARAAEKLEKITQWIDMVLAILQTEAGQVAKLQDALEYIGHELGVPSRFIVTAEERAAMQKQQQDEQATMMAAQMAMQAGEGA